MIYFYYYPARVESKKPLGLVSLEDFLKANQNPNSKIREVFKQIAEASANNNEQLRAKLKQENLYYFTPCVITNGQGRGYDCIIAFNGIAVIDFDKIENAIEFKYFMFEKYDSIIACWCSPSKRGIKALVKIPIVSSVDEFKSYFFGLGSEMEKYKGWDGSAQNPVLPLFLSVDEDLLYRDNAKTWIKKGIKINSFEVSAAPKIIIDTNDNDKAKVQKIIINLVDKIIDNGHPQVIAAGVTLGGYVATGYMDQIEAEQLLCSLIASNSYLSKGTKGYQMTAKSAIQKGTLSQLFLKPNIIEF